MGMIEVYAFLAALIAVMATVDLYRPVIQKYEMPLDIRFLYYFVCLTLGFLAAPLLLYPCVSKIKGLEFRDNFEKAVFESK